MKKFSPNEYGSSKTLGSDWEYCYLSLEVSGGKVSLRLGELTIPYNQIEDFIEFIRQYKTLEDSIEVHIPKPCKDGRFKEILEQEMNKFAEEAPKLFERDDVFFKELKK